jgi:hypothetical protein
VRAADELIDRIVDLSKIPSGKRQREIRRELRSHIDDFVVTARDAGFDQSEIERLLLANFGDPGQIAGGFSWVYRHERRRTQLFAYALSTVLIASLLLPGILAVQAGLAFSFGTPITKILASRHTLVEALDMLTSVAVYLGLTSIENLFGSQPFLRAVALLAVILTILNLACAAAGWHTTFLMYGLVSGVFLRAVQIFITPRLARIGIVVVCFPLAGLVSALLRAPVSHMTLAATWSSWLVMGAGYQLMTHFAGRVDQALVNGLWGFRQVSEGETT